MVAFIASEDARWITGQYIDATGGQSSEPELPPGPRPVTALSARCPLAGSRQQAASLHATVSQNVYGADKPVSGL